MARNVVRSFARRAGEAPGRRPFDPAGSGWKRAIRKALNPAGSAGRKHGTGACRRSRPAEPRLSRREAPPTMLRSTPNTRNRSRHLDRAGWLLWARDVRPAPRALGDAARALRAAAGAAARPRARRSTCPDTWVTIVVAARAGGAVLPLHRPQAARTAHHAPRARARGARTEDVSARLSEISALFQVSTTLHLQLKLDLVLEIIVRRVVFTLRAQQASIMLLRPRDAASS